MRKHTTTIRTLALAAALALAPLTATAMNHGGSGHGAMNHSSAPPAMDHGAGHGAMDHGAMAPGEVMLGSQTVAGVTGMAHLRDIGAAMAKLGRPETHHFMIMFSGGEGKELSGGAAAVKVTTPAGVTGKPVMLMAMPGGFGADLTLTEHGTYTFEVGSRLADGAKRTFRFQYQLP